MLGAIVDDLELARSKVQMALETYDFVITTGGVSVGIMISWATWFANKVVICCSTK